MIRSRLLVYKIPYRRAPRLAYRPSASREQRYLTYKQITRTILELYILYQSSDQYLDEFTLALVFKINLLARTLGLKAARLSARATLGYIV